MTKYNKETQNVNEAQQIIAKELNPIFCAAPFTHIHLGPGDKATTCCKSRVSMGEPSKERIEDFYNSDFAKDIRKHMLEGKQHWQCKGCYNYENETGGIAHNRSSSNKMALRHLEEIMENTLPDGTLKKPVPKFLDLLWSNRCNFACLGCTPELSTSIDKNFKEEFAVLNGTKIERYHPEIQGEWNSGNKEKIRFIIENSDSVKWIHLQGGEPFLVEEIFDLMDAMIEHGLHEKIRLLAHTNGSVSKSYKGKDLVTDYLQYWKDKAKINLSIDGIGQRGSYIRYGYVEEVWRKTFDKMAAADVKLGVSCRINIFNLLTIDELGSYLKNIMPYAENGRQESNIKAWHNPTLSINLIKIHEPSRLSAIDNLKKMQKNREHPCDWEYTIQSFVDWLEADNMPTQREIESFLRGVSMLDAKRKYTFDDTFPELADWKKAAEQFII